MKALVFHGPGRASGQDVPDPAIKDPADVVGGAQHDTVAVPSQEQ
ncbi:hypothetical protein [Streptomyces sp. NPDC089799]